MDEFARIEGYFAPLTAASALGLRDDAALMEDGALVVTKDCMVAGVHFIGDEDPALIARKLLRVNLSDLAAMGASPTQYMLGLIAPRDTPSAWFADFTRGLAEDQALFNITLLGGDTTATPGPLCLSLTAFGKTHGRVLRREGARVGDAIYATGSIGDAALGLAMLRGELPADASLVARYHLPEPRLHVAQHLHGIATSCMDISDGLLQDMGHIARLNHVAAVIEAEALPLSPTARALLGQDISLLERIVSGGDDYELLFTAPQDAADAMARLRIQSGVAITRIGHVVEGEGVTLVDTEGMEIPVARKGYRHF